MRDDNLNSTTQHWYTLTMHVPGKIPPFPPFAKGGEGRFPPFAKGGEGRFPAGLEATQCLNLLWPDLAVSAGRLAVLECRVRWYQRLTLALALGLVLGVSLAARTMPAVSDVLQARRLEVVDEAGKVGVTAYTTAGGGRLEVLNNTGQHVFSAGTVQAGKEPPGLWEQTLRTIDRQGRELDQQRRILEDLGRQLQKLVPARQTASDHAPQSTDMTQLRFDIEQQRRALEAVDRQLQSLTYQLRSLERR